MRFHKSFVFVGIALGRLLTAQDTDWGRTYNDGRILITQSKDGARFSVRAKEVARARVFDALKGAFGIEVRPVGYPAETISIDSGEQPLDVVIEQLQPKGARYSVRLTRELPAPLIEPRAKAGAALEKSGKLPAKPDAQATGAPPQPVSGPRKPAARASERGELVVPGGKPLSKMTLSVQEGRGPKTPVAQREQPRALRLNFLARTGGEVRLLESVYVDGDPPPSNLVRGDHVMLVRGADGRILYFETFPNPIRNHSYLPSGIHDVKTAREAVFGAWLPAELSQSSRIEGLRLSLHDATGVALPAQLSAENLEALVKRGKVLAEFRGPDLLRSIKGGVR